MKIVVNESQDNQISIVLSGAAGQGIVTVSEIVTIILKRSGYNVFSTNEYMSRVRGGINSTEIRVSNKRVRAFVSKIDILIPLNKKALDHLENRFTEETVFLGDAKIFSDHHCCNDRIIIDFSFEDVAKNSLGKTIYASTLAAGVICGLLQADMKIMREYISKLFLKKGSEIQEKNLEASQIGFEFGNSLIESGNFTFKLKKEDNTADEVLFSGTDAISIGAIAGGCNYLSFYPMSPATGVSTFLAQMANDFSIIVDQTEDEISAMNKAIGAWHTGARGLISTSGGGFALMSEGLSLAGMIESPIVIHLAQRPGPATGLPTRTEQADLELTLYAGHGDLPRIILAPGTIEEGFHLTQKAFNLADRYQIPVFVLTDQYFVSTKYNIPEIDVMKLENEEYIVKTAKDYKRYKITDDGISPRGIPSYGEGLIAVDSHTHTEDGHITEDSEVTTKMVNKRHKKLDLITKEAIEPTFIGSTDYNTLIISWGSTYPIIKEALEDLNENKIAFLHFMQVYPLNKEKFVKYLNSAERIIVIENNSQGQFCKLLKQTVVIEQIQSILKYDGRPFMVEEIISKLKTILKENNKGGS